MVFDRNSLPFVIKYMYTPCSLNNLCTYSIPILQILLNKYDLVNNKTRKA